MSRAIADNGQGQSSVRKTLSVSLYRVSCRPWPLAYCGYYNIAIHLYNKVYEKGYFWMERSHGSFRRNLALPEGIDYGKAREEFKNGVLEMRIPKSGEDALCGIFPLASGVPREEL
jgi:hypothetical protein